MLRLKKYSLKKQFIVLSMFLLTTCLVLTSFIALSIKDLLLDKQIAYSTSRALRFKSDIDYLYKRVSTLYEFIQFDPNLEYLLASPFSANTTVYLNNLNRLFLSLSIMNKDVADIGLISNDFAYSNLFDDDTLRRVTANYTNTTQINSLGIMSSSFFNATSMPYLVFTKSIFGFHSSSFYGDYLGNLLISIDPSKFATSLPRDTYEETTYFIIGDNNGNIYPFNCSEALASHIITTTISSDVFKKSTLTNDFIESENKDFLVYTSFIPELNYYIISAIDKNALSLQLKDILFLTSLIIGCIIIFIWLSIKLLLSNFLNPINNLYKFIKNIGEGNMKNLKQPISLEGSTEIVTLSNEFNLMISEITSLNKQLFTTTTRMYELELQKNKAELLHLRSQINPHFLYNTLESIRGLALENNCPQIAQIALGMGKIFHYSIKGANKTLLYEEVSVIKSYIDIQLIRFNSKFDVIYNIMLPTENLTVPKMILQPLIENAIFHGLEPKLESGILYLGSLFLDNGLQIIVQDDGIGIPKNTLEHLKESLALPSNLISSPTSHIGLLNVHNRIRLEYGDDYGLSIESTQGIGTKITILLPIINQGGHYA